MKFNFGYRLYLVILKIYIFRLKNNFIKSNDKIFNLTGDYTRLFLPWQYNAIVLEKKTRMKINNNRLP